MSRKPVLIAALVLAVYALLSVFRPEGLMVYFVPVMCWGLVALITLRIYGPEKIRLWFSKPVTIMAALTAALQIVSLILVSFFMGFGRSPYSFTPIGIAINIAYFSSRLLGLELSRTFLIKSCPKRRVFVGIGTVALFYAFISIPPTRFTTPGTPAETAKFLCSDLIPTLAQSLLATYLALLSGPAASIAYMGTLQAFEWLSPILPNPTWAVKALINVLIPTIGFVTVNQAVTPFTLMRLGIISRSEATGRMPKAKKSSPFTWTTTAVISVLLLWGSTGLLGFQPSIIASGSMRPTMDTGDIAILVKTPAEKLVVGDVIQFWREGDMIIHRVIDIYTHNGGIWFQTKGDANNVPDPNPVSESQVMGKAVFTIPKLGWASITIRETASKAFDILMNLPDSLMNYYYWITTVGVYLTTTLVVIVLSYTIVISTRKKKLEV